MIPRIKEKYLQDIRPRLKDILKKNNIMEVPRIEKIVLNMGVGEAIKEAKYIDSAAEELGLITGQKPVIRKAKKAISNFKLRKGMKVGVSVTLRDKRMYEFLDRLITVAIPRIRDFQGLSKKSFDGRGSYNFGIKEQIVFPEIKFDNVINPNGLNITLVTSAKTDQDAFELLKEIGFPFKKN